MAEKKLSKQERREAARAEAARIREEQARREKRNRMLTIGGVIAGLLLVVFAIFAIIQNSRGNEGKDVYEGLAVPANADATGGIPIGTNGVAGEVGEGPRVDLWVDYTCHFCIILEDQYQEAIPGLIESGAAQVYIHPIPLLQQGGPFTVEAANAAATVAQYAPEKFLEFHTALFGPYRDAIAAQEAGEQVTAPTVEDITAVAASVGVPQEVIDKFAAGEFKEWGQAAVTQFVGAREQAGTPELQVEGTVIKWSTPNALQDAVAAAAAGEDLTPFTYAGAAATPEPSATTAP